MRFDPQTLMGLEIPSTTQRYDWRDAVLYALGTAAGMSPDDPGDLAWVLGGQSNALPTMATVLGYQWFWVDHLPTGIDVEQVLHLDQRMQLAQPLPASGEVKRQTRVTGVADKGKARGSLVYVEETIASVATGAVIARLQSTLLCRGEGGHGDAGRPISRLTATPPEPPHGTFPIAGTPQQALIYRLSGDLNPLHCDPVVARRAGFVQPILHGLAVYGMAARTLLAVLCDGEADLFRSLDAGFTAPVYPGEPLELALWRTAPGEAAFRLVAPARQVCVLDNGRFTFGGDWA